METKEEKTTITLQKENEFRFEIDYEKTVTITLLEGTAEVFGSEMAKQRPYAFVGAKAGIFTWHGCVLEIQGSLDVKYVSDSTPMAVYLNTHLALDQRRAKAEAEHTRGPRVMIVGAQDVGKSSLSRILLNYAVKRGTRPMYIDLDVGQGAIAVPGTMGALLLDRPTDILEGITATAPLVYHYGHVSPAENPVLFKRLIGCLARTVQSRCDKDEKVSAAGYIINTCGWVDGPGAEIVRHAVTEFKADVVLVLDHERLHNELQAWVKETASSAVVVRMDKSGGAVARSNSFRQKERFAQIREYFYGFGRSLCPHSTLVKFDAVKLYKIGAPPVPLSCLPLGVSPVEHETKLSTLLFSDDLTHSILSVSGSVEANQAVVDTSIVGCIYVSHVDMAAQQMTVLAPAPGPLPRKVLLCGSLKWIE